jgi:hypothetical protein
MVISLEVTGCDFFITLFGHI